MLYKKSIIVISSILLFTHLIYASFIIRVSPIHSSSLRFGNVNSQQIVNCEVRIRIENTEGVKYEVKQKLLYLQNEKGQRIIKPLIYSKCISGSNSYGSLYQQTFTPLDEFERILYVSDNQGHSDNFTVVYMLKGSEIPFSGNFQGKILYILQPRRGNLRPQTFILNVYFTSTKKLSIKLKADKNYVYLKNDKPSDFFSSVDIECEGITQEVEIIQEYLPPQNQEAKFLPKGVLELKVESLYGDTDYKNFSSFKQRETLVSFKPRATKNLKIIYRLNPSLVSKCPQGIYTGTLNYIFISENKIIKTIPLKMKVEIKPLFKITVKSLSPQGLNFSNIQPGGSPQTRIVEIKVENNSFRPYEVIQHIENPLTHPQGYKIPTKFFVFKEEINKENKGEILYENFTPIKIGDCVIFRSDNQGTSSSFKVIFSLIPDKSLKAGNYSTVINYFLIEK